MNILVSKIILNSTPTPSLFTNTFTYQIPVLVLFNQNFIGIYDDYHTELGNPRQGWAARLSVCDYFKGVGSRGRRDKGPGSHCSYPTLLSPFKLSKEAASTSSLHEENRVNWYRWTRRMLLDCIYQEPIETKLSEFVLIRFILIPMTFLHGPKREYMEGLNYHAN